MVRGLSHAPHQVQLQRLKYVHLIGELTQGQCSLYGAWGNATAQTNSKLMQLRSFDWDMDGPFQVCLPHTRNEAHSRGVEDKAWLEQTKLPFFYIGTPA